MNILVLSGSPRPKGLSRQMVSAFRQGAEEAGHTVTVFDVCSMDIHGCRACANTAIPEETAGASSTMTCS